MLDADRQADHRLADAAGRQLLRRELGVGGRGRVDGQRLGVPDVGQMREELQAVDEPSARPPDRL